MNDMQAGRQIGNIRPVLKKVGARGIGGVGHPSQRARGTTNVMTEGGVARASGEREVGRDRLRESADGHHGGTLPRCVGKVEGAVPLQTELIENVPIIEPDGMSVFVKEGVIGSFAGDIVKVSEVADKNAFKLRTVATASSWFARFA